MVVFGAGEGGTQVITGMLRNPASRYIPVAIVDDDPRKQQLRVRSVPVRGRRQDLRRVAQEYHAEVMLIAIPSAGAALLREVSEVGGRRRATSAGPPAGQRVARGASASATSGPDRGRPARSPRDRHRHRLDRRLSHRPTGARHRSRRLDRLRAVPPDPPVRAGRADHARPRRVRPSTRCSCRSTVVRCSTRPTSSSPTSAIASGSQRSSSGTSPRWCSTPPPSSISRCSRCTRPRRSRPTCGHAQPARVVAAHGRRALRQHLDRQGRRSDQRARLHEAHRRAADSRPSPRPPRTST